MPINETYTVETSVGIFRVEKTEEHLKVGGKNFVLKYHLVNNALRSLNFNG